MNPVKPIQDEIKEVLICITFNSFFMGYLFMQERILKIMTHLTSEYITNAAGLWEDHIIWSQFAIICHILVFP